MKSIHGLISITTLLVAACTADFSMQELEQQNLSEGISVAVSAPDFVNDNGCTKSTISTTGAFAWTAGDKIGLFSNWIGNDAQNSSQLFLTLSAGEGASAAYSSTSGWALKPGNEFNYFSYYPYSENNSRDKITIDYTGQTQTANNSTSDLGAYDYMYSDMTAATSSSSASFSFHHIGCLVNVNIAVPVGYESTTYYQMILSADTQEFTSTATYSVNDIVTSEVPSLNSQKDSVAVLSFGDAGIKPTDGVISAWFMMAPAQWGGKIITAKLYASKEKVTPILGTFTPDANQTSGASYSYSVAGKILPERPAAGKQLHILLFGHSFGVDCTQYLPAITKAAGITDVHYGRFMQDNCALSQHWKHITEKDTYAYYSTDSSKEVWGNSVDRKVDDVLAEDPWDIIIFQQSIGFDRAGDYSSYQPHLNYLTHYVDSVCMNLHGKAPIIGWNILWGFNNDKSADYDIGGTTGALAMYQKIVKAAQDMVADDDKATPIPLIIPAGTALQNARGTSLNDPGSAGNPSTTKLLTNDGYHASTVIGRYVLACAWFQYLIAPIYGKTITGNNFRPATTMKSFENDIVDDERAAICWKCATEAVNHPYEVTKITEEADAENLSSSGTANCYIVPENGKYKFLANVKGNGVVPSGMTESSSIDMTDCTAEVIWETDNTTSYSEAGIIVSNATVDGDYIVFDATGTQGNALIALKDVNGKIVWSWHIWSTNANLNALAKTYPNKAGVMMDRNLGALSATSGNALALGFHYQWGRPCPITGYGAKKATAGFVSSRMFTTNNAAWKEVETTAETGTLAYSAANPTHFIYASASNYYKGTTNISGDWLWTSEYEQGNMPALWGSAKTMYDPCPVGWKVPGTGVWETTGFNSETFIWNNANKGCTFTSVSPEDYYPGAGCRGASGNAQGGALRNLGDGTYWSSSTLGAGGYTMTFSATYYMYTSYAYARAFGFSVRPCQE